MKSFMEDYGKVVVVAIIIVALITVACVFRDTGTTSIESMWENFKSYAEPTPDYLCFTAEEDINIWLYTNNSYTPVPSVQYSKDKKEWIEYKSYTTTIHLNAGEKCYWKGNSNCWSLDSTHYISFRSSGRFAANGNVMSLLDETCQSTTIPNKYCFRCLFKNCMLTTAPKLPATTLTEGCYTLMFSNCSSLISAPELPATILAKSCYGSMFMNCTSLTEMPKLPATILTEDCYGGMFWDCSNLETVHPFTVEKLADYCCRYMFRNCTKLKSAGYERNELLITSDIPSNYKTPFLNFF